MRIIRGKYGRRRFDVPSSITARPTTDFARENIFNVIENMIDIEGIRALDLFAGNLEPSLLSFYREAPLRSPQWNALRCRAASSPTLPASSATPISTWCAWMLCDTHSIGPRPV